MHVKKRRNPIWFLRGRPRPHRRSVIDRTLRAEEAAAGGNRYGSRRTFQARRSELNGVPRCSRAHCAAARDWGETEAHCGGKHQLIDIPWFTALHFSNISREHLPSLVSPSQGITTPAAPRWALSPYQQGRRGSLGKENESLRSTSRRSTPCELLPRLV